MPQCDFSPASDYYADFIYSYGGLPMDVVYDQAGTRCIDFVNPSYAIVYRPASEVLPLSIARDTYTAIPKLFGLLDTTALEAAGILQVFDQPGLRLTGKGVIIGMIDTGIDYQNPLFQNPDGTSRILRLWDQTIEPTEHTPAPDVPPSADSLPSAEPLSVPSYRPSYGTIYTQEDINAALASTDPLSIVPSMDDNGHGTFMAGVAAGNRTPDLSFSGAAPDAWLVVVKLKPAKQYLRDYFLIRQEAPAYQENDIMLAVRFLTEVAREFQYPLVIDLGVGSNQGSHDGTSPLAQQFLPFSSTPGIAAVVGAGNEVGFHHHFLGRILRQGQTIISSETEYQAGLSDATNRPPTEFEDVEIRVADTQDNSFCLELWATAPELFSVGFVSPSGEVIDKIAIIPSNEYRIPFNLESTVVTVSYRVTEIGTGSQLIFMRFENPSPGIWHLRVYPVVSITGVFHVWLPMHGFIDDDTIFLKPNPDTTIVEPGNAAFPFTIAAYQNLNNSIYIHSSHGFTRSDQIKPDLAAPGVDIQGPALPPATGSRTVTLTRRTGTSVAAAIAAGAIADRLQWAITDRRDLQMTSVRMKSTFIRSAQKNPALVYPNKEFGYGTLDLYGTFTHSE